MFGGKTRIVSKQSFPIFPNSKNAIKVSKIIRLSPFSLWKTQCFGQYEVVWLSCFRITLEEEVTGKTKQGFSIFRVRFMLNYSRETEGMFHVGNILYYIDTICLPRSLGGERIVRRQERIKTKQKHRGITIQ